jgi:hypothetical protein
MKDTRETGTDLVSSEERLPMLRTARKLGGLAAESTVNRVRKVMADDYAPEGVAGATPVEEETPDRRLSRFNQGVIAEMSRQLARSTRPI